MKRKRCPYCGRYYRQDARAQVQKCCGRPDCQGARKRENLRRWRSLHPRHGEEYAPKERAWAKGYPNYWRAYRKAHPDYVARDNRRRIESRRRAKLSANETGMRHSLVEKLHALDDLIVPEVSANETGFHRRVFAIEDCLRSTAALALSAKGNRDGAAEGFEAQCRHGHRTMGNNPAAL